MTTSPLFESEYDRDDYYRQINRRRELFEFGGDLLPDVPSVTVEVRLAYRFVGMDGDMAVYQ